MMSAHPTNECDLIDQMYMEFLIREGLEFGRSCVQCVFEESSVWVEEKKQAV